MRRTITGKQQFKGRGALSNPAGRFDLTQLEAVDDGWFVEESPDSIATTLEPDSARAVITTNDSPDIPFEQSINPYRGCEHACLYCTDPRHARSHGGRVDSGRSPNCRRATRFTAPCDVVGTAGT